MASIPDKLVPGYNLFIGDEPPLAPNENDLWFDTISNKWWVWTGGVWTTVGSGTGVPEAPTDGAAYRRIDAAWLTDPLAGDAPINGVSYLRKNGTWAAASESTGVPEAPNDNKPYHRKNLAWEEDPLFGDAPIDGNYYLRQDGAWVPSGAALGVPEAPNDGVGYTRKDEAWAADPLQADAALDSKHYGRYNAAWTAVPIQSDAANDSIPKLRLMAAGVASWLDAGDSAQKDVGTAADEVAAGDHTHVTLPTTNQKAGLDAAATPITGANPVLTAGDAGVGDMTKAVYDPQGFNGDAFARANHTGTQVLATISNAGNSAGLNTGTTAGTVALGDHGHATLLNPNQKAGIDANASLSGLNAVATMADLPAGGGDVVGPATAVDGNLAVFDGTTGKLIKDGGVPGSGGIEEPVDDGNPKMRRTLTGVSTWITSGGAAVLNVGVSAGTVAAGDHGHVTLPTTDQKAGLDAAATPITGANPVITAADVTGGGDMTKAVYDPTGINSSAFTRVNHTGTQTLATISDSGNSAGLNTGTTAGTVALGDHGHATLLNPNQKAGIDANASLSGLNAVATMADLPAGGGDVVGPATAVDGNLAVFDGTTGKLIKDGGVPGSGGIEEPVDDGNPKMRRTLTGVSTWITSGGAAVLNVGVSAGTVAAGDHGHVTLPTTDQKAGLDAAATPITGANPVITAADVTGGGDMTKAVYDPTGINSSAFTRVNHTGTQTLATISDSGDSAGLDVGTIAGTVAAGDHTHVTVPVHATTHKTGGADVILLDELGSPTDITALNVSVTAHGLTPKAPNDAAQFLNGLGSWSIPDVGASESVAMAVYNETGATLAKGSAVYVNGWKTGNEVPTVALAQSNSSTTMPALGIVIADMISSSEGTVQVAGAIPGFDTSAYALNSPLYVDAVIAGNLTETKPAESHLIQSLAKVLRVNVSNGSLVVAGALRSNDIPNFSAADKFWYGGTLGGATEGDVTVYARTIMDDPDATATRITLGLGDSSVLDVGTTTNTVAAGDHTHATLPTTDQKAALDGANGPSAGNEFATVSDLKSIFPDRVAITQSGATLDTDLDGNAYTVQLIDAGNTTGWSTAALPSPSTKKYTCSVDFLAPATGSSTVAVNGAWQQMGVSGAITMAAGEDPVSCILRSRTDGIIQLYRSETAA